MYLTYTHTFYIYFLGHLHFNDFVSFSLTWHTLGMKISKSHPSFLTSIEIISPTIFTMPVFFAVFKCYEFNIFFRNVKALWLRYHKTVNRQISFKTTSNFLNFNPPQNYIYVFLKFRCYSLRQLNTGWRWEGWWKRCCRLIYRNSHNYVEFNCTFTFGLEWLWKMNSRRLRPWRVISRKELN